MDKINESTSECFIALSQLREIDSPSISPELIHDRLRGFIEAMRTRVRESATSSRDADDIAGLTRKRNGLSLDRSRSDVFFFCKGAKNRRCEAEFVK